MKLLKQSVIALGVGAGLGIAHHVVVRGMLYKAYFSNDNYWNRRTLMCTRHPGNGLLLWSDGRLLCYECGREKYKGKDVHIKRDPVWDMVHSTIAHFDHVHWKDLLKGFH